MRTIESNLYYTEFRESHTKEVTYTKLIKANNITEAFGIAHKCIDDIREKYDQYLIIVSIKEFDIMLIEEAVE